MKSFLLVTLFLIGYAQSQALIVSEVFSNPVGDDSGREWFEIYNDTTSEIDLSTLAISIKDGTPVSVTPIQGGTMLSAGSYAVIGSTVSGQTKFLQDHPSYTGLLFRASISLVNSGVTSIDVQLNNTSSASLASYTAAKEGTSLSFIGGSYVSGTPTPGGENQAAPEVSTSPSTDTATTTDTQVTIPQATPPTPDIVIYLPSEKVAVAGADTNFSTFSLTRAGKPISSLAYSWAFGDGGQATGSSTKYRYVYSGRYLTQVEALNATTVGTARMVVRVVAPDITISSVGSGKYGSYIDVTNPNDYELDLSQWMFLIDGASFPFPKNTILLPDVTTRFSGAAMGFASTTFTGNTVIKIIFPNLEEVTRYVRQEPKTELLALQVPVPVQIVTTSQAKKSSPKPVPKIATTQKTSPKPIILGTSTSQPIATTSIVVPQTEKSPRARDTRIVSFIKALFE